MPSTDRRDADVASSTDALTLLANDHAEVRELFDQYKEIAEDAGALDDQKQSLAEDICTMLTVHAMIEEEIFYPAAREALDDASLLDEAEVEHQAAKDLIAQIQDSDPTDALYDARVNVLGEYVNHHVQEEEAELFPQVREAGIDLDSLGAEMSTRQSELLSEEVEDEGE
jgi:hemerythrin superfamily protein